jgi:hypothetical protein
LFLEKRLQKVRVLGAQIEPQGGRLDERGVRPAGFGPLPSIQVTARGA